MATTNMPGIPAEGLRKVRQIMGTNEMLFHADTPVMEVALELLSSHTSGAPVVDGRGQCIGFISEFDVLKALRAKKDLNKVTAREIMNRHPLAVTVDTTIEEAAKLMEENHYHSLPVEQDGKVIYSLTRHDLLRAWVGAGAGMEQ